MSIVLNGTTGVTTPDVTSDGSLKIDASAPDDSLVVDASGNVGIGTSSPNALIHGNGSAVSALLLTTNTYNTNGTELKVQGDGSSYLYNRENAMLRFGTNNLERMRIDSSGNLLVGTTSSLGRLTVDGDTRLKSTYPILDNVYDVGTAGFRWDDIFATNGTIQTSDRNEKQDIEALSEAEARVAVACKGLLRKFRWKDAVAEKGDEARIHFGIIAQDLQDAFAAEGLDAGRYAMFISSTWTDEETGEERTRLGVRYPELLAFIIGAI